MLSGVASMKRKHKIKIFAIICGVLVAIIGILPNFKNKEVPVNDSKGPLILNDASLISYCMVEYGNDNLIAFSMDEGQPITGSLVFIIENTSDVDINVKSISLYAEKIEDVPSNYNTIMYGAGGDDAICYYAKLKPNKKAKLFTVRIFMIMNQSKKLPKKERIHTKV